MKIINKKVSYAIASIIVAASIFGVCFYNVFVKADSPSDCSSIKRDTSISVDSSGELQIKRNSIEDSSTMGKEDTWTIFMYVCGSDLETMYGSASADFREMMSARIASSTIKNVNIIIQTGGSYMWRLYDIDGRKSQRFKMESIGGLTLLEESEPRNMGDPQTLYDFLKWGVENYPAEHMSTIFWNHGTGVSKGICADLDFEEDSLTLPEIEYAFSKVSKDMTSKFELIGFDACLSGSLEYANALAPYAKYMVASADVEPGTGWSYQEVINRVLDYPDTTGDELGEVICDTYYDACIKGSKSARPTMATYDLSKVDNVCKEMNSLAKYMYENITTDDMSYKRFSNMATAVERVRYGANGENMDIGSLLYYFDVSCDYDYDTDGFKKALDEFIVSSKISNVYANYKAVGLSIYYPTENLSIQEFNVMRNAIFSPYYLKYIEFLTYNRLGGSKESFKETKWENSDCFYEDTFEFLKYYKVKQVDVNTMKDILCQNSKYLSDGFVDNWFSNFANSGTNRGGAYYGDNSPYTHRDIKLSAEGNSFTATVDSKSADYIDKVYNSIFTYLGDSLICLGEDNSATFDETTGEMKSNFNGEWLMLPDGQLLTTYVEENAGETIYSIPVVIDDKEMSIKLLQTKNNKGENVYELLGVWDATADSNYGPRGYLPLEVGTKITPIYDVYDEENNTYESEYGEEYTIASDFDFLFGQLDKNEYEYAFAIESINGETSYSERVEL